MIASARIRVCGIRVRRRRSGRVLISRRLAGPLLMRFDVAVCLQLVLPVGNDHFIRHDSARNLYQIAFGGRNRDWPHFHGLVLFDYKDIIALRTTL